MARRKATTRTAAPGSTAAVPAGFTVTETAQGDAMRALGYPWHWKHEHGAGNGYAATAADCLREIRTYAGIE